MSINFWQPQGVVIAPVSTDHPGQPNVLYESGAVILSGTVFKNWFGTKNGVCYAESTDGITWTRYSSNPVIAIASLGTNPFGQCYPRLFKNAGTYYLYVNCGDSATQTWTSTDGVTWTQAAAAGLAGFTQAWESSFIGQLNVAGEIAGTWYGYYTAYNTTAAAYQMGQATSTDLINWTKNASNPVITQFGPSNFCFQKVGSTFYGWSEIVQAGIPNAGGNGLPSDITRYSASSPAGPWTPLTISTFYRTRAEEGVGNTGGQVADPTIVAANGNLYMYYTVIASGGAVTQQQISCAIAFNMTFAQLVQTNEGVFDVPFPSNTGLALSLNTLASDTFQRANANPIGGNWTPLFTGAGFVAAQLLNDFFVTSTAGDNDDSYWNAISWPNDQWVSFTVGPAGSLQPSCFAGVDLRATAGAFASANTYRFYIEGPIASAVYALTKYLTGTPTVLVNTTSLTMSAGDTFTFTMIGNTISFLQNGNLLLVLSDSSLSSGVAGIFATGSSGGGVASAQIAAFSGGGVVPTPTPPPPASGSGGGFGPDGSGQPGPFNFKFGF